MKNELYVGLTPFGIRIGNYICSIAIVALSEVISGKRTGVLFTDVIFTYFTPVVINNINNCTDCWKRSLSLFVEGRTTIYIVTDPQKTGPIARKLQRFLLFLWYYYYYLLTHWGWECWVSLDVQSEVTRINHLWPWRDRRLFIDRCCCWWSSSSSSAYHRLWCLEDDRRLKITLLPTIILPFDSMFYRITVDYTPCAFQSFEHKSVGHSIRILRRVPSWIPDSNVTSDP